MPKNPRHQRRKLHEDLVSMCKRRAAAGEPCGICGRPIDMQAPQYIVRPDGKRIKAPWAFEMDHIVPYAQGGALYDPQNVQPSHRACNERKGGGKKKKPITVIGLTSRRW